MKVLFQYFFKNFSIFTNKKIGILLFIKKKKKKKKRKKDWICYKNYTISCNLFKFNNMSHNLSQIILSIGLVYFVEGLRPPTISKTTPLFRVTSPHFWKFQNPLSKQNFQVTRNSIVESNFAFMAQPWQKRSHNSLIT